MARIVSRRPVIGFSAGALFGALGWLLIDIEGASVGVTPLAPLLFKLSGYFFLFVAAMAIVAALLSMARTLRR